LGIGDWGLGIGPNPQSPIPYPQIVKYNNIVKFKWKLMKVIITITIKLSNYIIIIKLLIKLKYK